jgi:hypothetical protein
VLVIIISSAIKVKEDDEGLPFNSYEFTPEWISADSPKYTKIHTIPDFSFTNQNGETITKETVDGKIYVANFYQLWYLSKDDYNHGDFAPRMMMLFCCYRILLLRD